MKKLFCGLITLWMLVCTVSISKAQVSIGIGLPNVSIGINLPLFPDLAPVPGYPVYYAPRVDANYFFYDGMYWVYQDDYWYASSWYNGPWWLVEPEAVPLYILRIPVRYYRQPPVYFRGWQSNEPPRWGKHWGHSWEQHRRGWDKWKRGSTPARAPLPVYQRQYSGDRYPQLEQQQTLRSQRYRYQPRDKVVRQHFQQQGQQGPNAPSVQRGRRAEPQMRSPSPPAPRVSVPADDPRLRPPQRVRDAEQIRNTVPEQSPHQPRGPVYNEQKQRPGPERERQSPVLRNQEQRSQERGGLQEQRRDSGQGQRKDGERSRERDN